MRPIAPILLAVAATACTPRRPRAVSPPSGKAPVATAAGDASVANRPYADQYPATRVSETRETIFGTVVDDPYRWLEDGASPEVQRWVDAEDHLARAKLDALAVRPAIAQRLGELFQYEQVGAPMKRGLRIFQWRRRATEGKYALLWKQATDEDWRVLLDPNTWPADGHLPLVDASPSRDGTRVAYRVSKNNADEHTTRVVDVATGHESAIDTIAGTQFGPISWSKESDGFYYRFTPQDGKGTPSERYARADIRFHVLGQHPSQDRVVHASHDDANAFMTATVSRDGHWLIADTSMGWTANVIEYQDLRRKPGVWQPLAADKDANYGAYAYRDRFYVQTNQGAPRGRLFVVDPTRPARNDWKEIVAERSDAKLQDFEIIGGKLVLTYLKDASTRVEVHELDGALVREVPLPTIGSASVSGEPDDDDAFIQFSSFAYPTEILQLSVATGALRSWYRVRFAADVSQFVTDQVWYTSKDGTRVPMFIVHRKDLKRDGSSIAYMTGYGGLAHSVTPAFGAHIVAWLERGGVYAVPNLRGGGELSEAWHAAGMLHQKQNVFDDFYAAAEFLVREGYTSADKRVAVGGSNGGLLMGAAITQRPELFRAVICEAPLLDMIRYDRTALGKPSVAEFGSPEKEDDFRALFAYSPYHHVVGGTRYPSVLMMSSDSDDRVDPMHARSNRPGRDGW